MSEAIAAAHAARTTDLTTQPATGSCSTLQFFTKDDAMLIRNATRCVTATTFFLSCACALCDAPTADDYVAFFAGEVGQWKWERQDGEQGMTYCEMSPTKRFLTYYVTKGGEPYLNGVAGFDAAAQGWKMMLFGVESEGDTTYTGITVLDKSMLDKMGKEQFTYTVSSTNVLANGAVEESTQKVIVLDADTREYQTSDGQFFLKTTRVTASDHMSALSTFVGSWVMERKAPEDGPGVKKGDVLSITMENEWVLDMSAMKMTAATSVNGVQVNGLFGTVGWDPAQKAIVFHGFRSPGGTAYSKWLPVGNDWHLVGHETDSNGVTTSRTVIVSDVTDDAFSVQTVDRVVDGVKREDLPKAYWNRVQK
jgi:hypothetical protein